MIDYDDYIDDPYVDTSKTGVWVFDILFHQFLAMIVVIVFEFFK